MVILLHSGTYQPRDSFSEEPLDALSKTIAQVGVLEPLIVRLSSQCPGHFEIIAGERRHRAAQRAGLSTVPCLLSNYSNEQAAQIALIENISREGLNPIAEALAMQRLATEFSYTHDEIADLLGIARTQVTNMLRLLKLDAPIQHFMKQGALSESHGKILAGLPLEKQYWFAYEAIKKEWSVSTLDNAIKTEGDTKQKTVPKKPFEFSSTIEQKVSEQLGFPVNLTINKNEGGCFRIHFQDREHMQKILEKLCCLHEKLPVD